MIGRVLFTGGARSGKSHAAESLLAGTPSVRYVATAAELEGDREWHERVARHRDRRPIDWITVETSDLVGEVSSASADSPVLIDCLTLWLSGRLDALGAWNTEEGSDERAEAVQLVESEITQLAAAVGSCMGGLVMVTNEVGSGIVPATPAGRIFRDLLGICNAVVAAQCDEVCLVVAGHVLPLRPVIP